VPVRIAPIRARVTALHDVRRVQTVTGGANAAHLRQGRRPSSCTLQEEDEKYKLIKGEVTSRGN
jgi:hypothetical protein